MADIHIRSERCLMIQVYNSVIHVKEQILKVG